MASVKWILHIAVTLNLLSCLLSVEPNHDRMQLIKVMNEQNSDSKSWLISPASINTVLEELYIGSAGNTKTQLASSIDISGEKQIIEEQNALSAAPGKGVTWKMANKILVKDTFPLTSTFKSKIISIFHSEMVNSDFSDPEATAKSVNSWVSSNTDGQIKELVSPGDVGPTNVMVLLNAVYFKGTWKYAFKDALTEEGCFYIQPGKCNDILMMNQRNKFKYGVHKQLAAQVVQLPYADDRYSMVIVLPDKQDGVKEVVNKLSNNQLIDFIKQMKLKDVDLFMPKFTTKFKASIKQPLMKMGVTSIFDPSADFSVMTDAKGIFVSEVIHEAHITVSEDGTIAAAATGAYLTRQLEIHADDIIFYVNHPFLYYIFYNNTHVLFAGEYIG